MGRTSDIDESQIIAAIDQLKTAGKTINAASLRLQLGRGSPNFIQRFLDQLRLKDKTLVEEGSSEIPKHVQKKFEEIYSELRNLAGYELKSLQAQHQKNLNEIGQQLTVFQNYSVELEAKIEHLEKQIFDQEVQLKVNQIQAPVQKSAAVKLVGTK
jgi:polyhydroxyalkanoate synthesis regulator phasin